MDFAKFSNWTFVKLPIWQIWNFADFLPKNPKNFVNLFQIKN